MKQGGCHIRTDGDFPEFVCFCHVTAATSLHGDRSVLSAARAVEDVVNNNDAGHDIVRNAPACPKDLTSFGVVSPDEFLVVHDQFGRPVFGCDNRGCRPCSVDVFNLPDNVSRMFIHGNE